MTLRARLGIGALALGGLLAVYGPHVRSAPFVYEDARLIDGVTRAWTWAGLARGRGLTMESWTVIRTPQASHALNLALHLVVVGLTGALLWQLTSQVFVAVGAAAVVALHPVAIEGVAYAASRAELIAAIGALLVLLCVTSAFSWTWALVPFFLGLAYTGKETGLVAIGLIPLALWLKGETAWASRGAWLCVGFSLTAVLFANAAVTGVMAHAEYAGARIDPDTWMAIQAVAAWRLVVLSVAPFWLSVAPDVEAVSGVAQIAAGILLAGLLEIAWRLRQPAPLATFGILWCALVVAPRFLVRTPHSPLNEHQIYLALPGVACVWIAALQALAARWPAWLGWGTRCPA